jgi:hypothetical protein
MTGAELREQQQSQETIQPVDVRPTFERTAGEVFWWVLPETIKTLQYIFESVQKLWWNIKAEEATEQLLQTCSLYDIPQNILQTLSLSSPSNIYALMQNPGILMTYFDEQQKRIAQKKVDEIKEKQVVASEQEDANVSIKNATSGLSLENNEIINERDWVNQEKSLVSQSETLTQTATTTALESALEQHNSLISSINTKALAYIQTPSSKLVIPPQQLATVQLTISLQAQEKLDAQGITPDVYKTYLYALHHPDAMPTGLRDIVWSQDPQELIRSMNAEYGISVTIALDRIPVVGEKSFDAIRYTSTAIIEETGKQRDEHGFDTIFTTFADGALEKNSPLHAQLDAAIARAFSPDWAVDTKANPQTSQPWFEQVWYEWLHQSTDNFRTITPEMLRALMQTIVPADKTEKAVTVFMRYAHEVARRNPWEAISPEQQKGERKIQAMLDAIIKKRFFMETHTVAKTEVAQRYLGQIAELLKTWWQSLIVHGWASWVAYLPDGGMCIEYHTSQAPTRAESLAISADGTVRMSTHVAAIEGSDAQRRSYMMEWWTTVLPGRVLSLNDIAALAARDTQRYTQARSQHMKQWSSHDAMSYQKTLLRAPSVLSPNEQQHHDADVIKASLTHTLSATKIMDVVAYEAWSRPGTLPDAFTAYYTGKESFVDKHAHPELTALFALRNTCLQSSASDIQQGMWAYMQLLHSYPITAWPDRSPFSGPNASIALYKAMEYFTLPAIQGGWFDIWAFTRFTESISRENSPPRDIDAWLAAKEERLSLIPLQSMRRREVERRHGEQWADELLRGL